MSNKSRNAAREHRSHEQFLKYGLEIASSGGATVAGALLGSLATGLEGALVGAAGGKTIEIALSAVWQEIWARQLAKREKVRVGTVLAVVTAEIRERLEAGESVRADDFFDVKLAGRSDAEEVAESVLLKVQREPEERKIPYMGYLLSSSVFDAEVSAQLAHQLIKIAEQLTYRQLCILKLAEVKEEYGLSDKDYAGKPIARDLYQVLYECAELNSKEYIRYMDIGMGAIVPAHMTLQGLGEDLFNLMKLSLIPEEDITPIAEQLK